jgi:hypothetical protein
MFLSGHTKRLVSGGAVQVCVEKAQGVCVRACKVPDLGE